MTSGLDGTLAVCLNFHLSHGNGHGVLPVVADISSNLDKGVQNEARIMDLSEVFDKVNHQKLTSILENKWVCYQVCSWWRNS